MDSLLVVSSYLFLCTIVVAIARLDKHFKKLQDHYQQKNNQDYRVKLDTKEIENKSLDFLSTIDKEQLLLDQERLELDRQTHNLQREKLDLERQHLLVLETDLRVQTSHEENKLRIQLATQQFEEKKHKERLLLDLLMGNAITPSKFEEMTGLQLDNKQNFLVSEEQPTSELDLQEVSDLNNSFKQFQALFNNLGDALADRLDSYTDDLDKLKQGVNFLLGEVMETQQEGEESWTDEI